MDDDISKPDQFDKLIEPAFEFLRREGARELALRLIALSVDYERSVRADECLLPALQPSA